MRIVILTLVCVFTLSSAFAGEDEWVYITSSNKEDVYMRTASVENNNDFYNSVSAWVKYENKTPDGHDIAKIKYYCKSDSFEKLESHTYDQDGNYVNGYTKSAKIQYAIPDTIGVALTEAACVSGALTKLVKFHYMDDGDITEDHYRDVISDFGEYSLPAMLYYNEQTGSKN